MSETLSHRLVAALRSTAQSYAAGDQVAPCAVLWTDPERLWEGVIPALQAMLPELFQFDAMMGVVAIGVDGLAVHMGCARS